MITIGFCKQIPGSRGPDFITGIKRAHPHFRRKRSDDAVYDFVTITLHNVTITAKRGYPTAGRIAFGGGVRNANRPGGPIPGGRFAAIVGNYASNGGNAK